jgi:thiol-disulfide isomerase/thioredoxin
MHRYKVSREKRMDIFLVIALMAVALIVFIQLRSSGKARAMQGMPAPDTREVDGDVTAKKKVYFFHATHCSPCKSIMPLVDEIRKDHPNLIKVEVSEHSQLARAFKLAGTPSFFAVDDGNIMQVKLGLSDEKWLRYYLQDAHE